MAGAEGTRVGVGQGPIQGAGAMLYWEPTLVTQNFRQTHTTENITFATPLAVVTNLKLTTWIG